MNTTRTLMWAPLWAAASCGWSTHPTEPPPPPEPAQAPAPARPNLLVVVLDDVGMSRLNAQGVPEIGLPTPQLDAFAARGMRFERAWTHPSCSPTRAALLTGRLPFRYGLGQAIPYNEPYELPLSETTLAEALAPYGYTSMALGKWHLAGDGVTPGERHAQAQGFAHHLGSVGNLSSRSGTPSYFRWNKNVDGKRTDSTTYATTDTTNDAIAAMSTLKGPWFLWVAYNAIHAPHHAPPAELVTKVPGAKAPDHVLAAAMLEALDTELGRLLDAVTQRDDTWVVVLGDNGFAADALPRAVRSTHVQAMKGAASEGGTRVPWVVWGPSVPPGSHTQALVQDVDLFPTLLDLAGAPLDAPTRAHLDGISFAPVLRDPASPSPRHQVVVRVDLPNGQPPTSTFGMVTDGQHKVIFRPNGRESRYDLTDTWPEGARPIPRQPPRDEAQFETLERVWSSLATPEP